MKEQYRSERGLGIMEVVIASGLVVVVTMAMMQLFSSMTGQQQHLVKSFERQKILDNLRATLSASDICAQRLGIQGQTRTDSMNLTSIQLINGETLSGVANADGLLASSLELIATVNAGTERKMQPAIPAYPTPQVVDYTRMTGNLNVVIRKAQPGFGGPEVFRAEAFPIILLVNSSGVIDHCYTGGNNNDQVCTEMFNATYDADRTPKCRLNSFSVADFYLDQISGTGVDSKGYFQDGLSIFGTGASRLRLQSASIVAGSVALNNNADQFADIAYSANSLVLTPPTAGASRTFSFASNGEAVMSGMNLQLARTAANPNGAMLSVLGLATDAGLAVTGTSQFTGNLTVNGMATINGPSILLNGPTTIAGSSILLTGPTNVTGNVQVTGTIQASGTITALSDRRLKKDFKTITHALDKISYIKGVTYLRRDLPSDDRHIGVIAQELQAQFPEAVHRHPSGYLSVNYNALNAILLEAVKELNQEVKKLRAEVDQLKAQGR